MEPKLEEFKKAALSEGHTQEAIDQIIKAKNNRPESQVFREIATQQGYSPYSIERFTQQMPSESGAIMQNFRGQSGVGGYRITQPFGARSALEKYSGGINLGADLATPTNTQLKIPPGRWRVIKASPGWSGGSGNMVSIQNEQGEIISYEHLNQINVRQGQMVQGGDVAGLSGSTGNSTGPHSSLPFMDSSGMYKDIMSTPYARHILGG